MTDYIRRLVSGNKARFKDEDLKIELDLVYVTDQVIVMGFPASGIEGLYRNRREDALRFLESRHGQNYWVYNFCPIAENSYDKNVFGGRVTRYPFPDHHAPPLATMPLVARDVRAWISGAPDRVAVLHCKAGKGRSGTMACSYLLSLDDSPVPPRQERSYSAKEWAKRRVEGAVHVLPPDGENQPQASSTTHTSSLETPVTPFRESAQPPNILGVDSREPMFDTTVTDIHVITLSPPPSSPNPEKSSTDALKGVLDLHTARRMKSLSELEDGASKGIKVSQGVSIPSQRRFLYYWALILAHESPKHLWAVDSLSLPDAPLRRNDAPHPKVRLTQLRLRMRKAGNIKMGIVKAANAIIQKTGLAKGPGKPIDGFSSGPDTQTKSEKEKNNGSDSNQIWASLARYDDDLINVLEEWEVFTRDKDGHMGKRRHGSGHLPDGKGEEDALNELFEGGKWDKGKMVRTFARLGVLNKIDEEISEDKDEKIHNYTLRPLSDKRWEGLKNDIYSHGEGRSNLLPPEGTEKPGVSRSEANSMYDVTSTSALNQAPLNLEQGVVLDAGKEIRVKLYMGQVFMGWLWFVPTFHMPQPPPSPFFPSSPIPPSAIPSPSEAIPSTAATLHLSKKDLDFPLGIGSGIIDVDIDMEWVVPPTTASSLPIDVGPPVSKTEANNAGSDILPGRAGLEAAVRINVGGVGHDEENTSGVGVAAELKQTVEGG